MSFNRSELLTFTAVFSGWEEVYVPSYVCVFFLGEGVDETGAESGLGRRDGHSSAARLRSSSLQPPSLRPLHVRDHGNPEGTDVVTSSRGGGGEWQTDVLFMGFTESCKRTFSHGWVIGCTTPPRQFCTEAPVWLICSLTVQNNPSPIQTPSRWHK